MENTASSSVAAAAIARIPILANDRILDVYDYVRGPAYLRRNVSEGEIAALGRLRADKTVRRPREEEWEALFADVHRENADMWARVLRWVHFASGSGAGAGESERERVGADEAQTWAQQEAKADAGDRGGRGGDVIHGETVRGGLRRWVHDSGFWDGLSTCIWPMGFHRVHVAATE